MLLIIWEDHGKIPSILTMIFRIPQQKLSKILLSYLPDRLHPMMIRMEKMRVPKEKRQNKEKIK